MARAKDWIVTNDRGANIATCVHIEDAAVLVSHQGAGAKIKYGRELVVWEEGEDGDGSAAESYDRVAEVAHWRIDQDVTGYPHHGLRVVKGGGTR